MYDFFHFEKFNKINKEGFFKSRVSYIYIFLKSFYPLVKLIRKEKPKYLVSYLITSLPIILFLIFKFETKLIINIAGQPKLNFLRKFLWKKISKTVSYVICPSIELKNNLVKYNIFDESKIFVIQDPHINIQKINFLKSQKIESNFFKEGKIILSIGRLTKQKNFAFLINNFLTIYKKYNDFKLAIIGDGEEKEYLLKLIKRNNLDSVVKIIGYKENIYNYLRASNYYISTSNWEGSSLAMIDAAVIGLPILCSDCPTGRKEFIGDNERGYMYSRNNPQDFLIKFEMMINDGEKKLFKKIVSAKKQTKKFTFFRHYLNLSKII